MPNDDEIIRRAHSWLTEMGLRSAEVNLVAVLAEFATAQVREAERDTRERLDQQLKAEIAKRKKWQQLAESLYENANIELAERIRGKGVSR